MKTLSATLVALATLLWLVGCESHPPPSWELQGATMGTTYTVKISTPSSGLDRGEVERAVADILDGVEQKMSTYIPDSELSRFNLSRATTWHQVSEDTARVVVEAIRVGELSGGTFDVTVGPLVNLWGFGPDARPERIPSDAELRAAKARVGFQRLEVHQHPSTTALRKNRPDMAVDLSALAKGFACDKVAEYVERQGLLDYMVEVGGELRVRGHNAEGRPWRIAIEQPRADRRNVLRVIEPGRNAVATSGDYRNYFEYGGRRYSHTIDPRTGFPIDHRLVSATVVHPSAMTADAFATALMVLGPQPGMALAKKLGLAALLVSREDGEFVERYTQVMTQYIE